MTAATIVENITREWKKISDGQCEVQSINDRSTFDKLQFDFYIGEEMPASDGQAFMRIRLFDIVNFHRAAPVWLRLNGLNTDNEATVVVIKEA